MFTNTKEKKKRRKKEELFQTSLEELWRTTMLVSIVTKDIFRFFLHKILRVILLSSELWDSQVKCGSPSMKDNMTLRGDLRKKGKLIKWSCLNKHFAKRLACKEVGYLTMSGIKR